MNRKLQQIYSEQVDKQKVSLRLHTIREYNSKTDVKQAIIDSNPELKAGADKRGAIRLQPVSKVQDKEEFTKRFLDTLNDINLVVVDKIGPGPDSPSSKFDSYVVASKTNKEKEFIITLGGGANKGQSFEQDVMKSLIEYFEKLETEEEIEKPSILEEIEEALGVEFIDVDKGTSFNRAVKRPLTDQGANDRGNEIADVTLIDSDGVPYYISLKDKNGKTVSNGGATGMFEVEDGKVEFVNKERDSIGKKLFKAAGANISLIERGLTDYFNKVKSPDRLQEAVDTTDRADINLLEKFLMSAFDYGYIYVKQKNAKNFEVADLKTPDQLRKFIGDIEAVKVKYPYYENEAKSRKHVSVVIETSNGVYSFDVRNASGQIIPNQINLVRQGSKGEMKAAKASVVKTDSEDNLLKNILGDLN